MISLTALSFIVGAVFIFAYSALRWAGPRMWRAEVSNIPPAPMQANRLTFVEAPRERPPFPDTWSACRWFFIMRVSILATQTAGLLTVVLSLLLLYVLKISVDISTLLTPYVAGVAGSVYLSYIRYLERTGAVHSLPLSPWQSTLNHLRLIRFGVYALLVAALPVYLLELYLATDLNPLGTCVALVWLVWIAWAGLSFAPMVMLAMLPLIVWEQALFLPQVWAVLFSALALAVIVLGRDAWERTADLRNLWNTLIIVSAAAAALVYCHAAISAPAPLWIAREILGGAIVLALLRYNLETHRIPARAALRVAVWLVLCVTAATTMFAVFGPPGTPHGVALMYLGLGVVAPLFLPLLWIPHAIEWAKAPRKPMPEPAGEAQREMWENLR